VVEGRFIYVPGF